MFYVTCVLKHVISFINYHQQTNQFTTLRHTHINKLYHVWGDKYSLLRLTGVLLSSNTCKVKHSPRIQAVYGLLYIDGSITVWELLCVEVVGNICTRAYMQFDLIEVLFHHMTYLKWIFSNVKNYSESIGGVVFPDTCTHLLLNEQFLTSTCKIVSLS